METGAAHYFPISIFQFLVSMIQGNQTWQLALAQPQKQAFYTVEIPDFSIAIASFSATAPVVTTLGGYGVTIYGVGGYGT